MLRTFIAGGVLLPLLLTAGGTPADGHDNPAAPGFDELSSDSMAIAVADDVMRALGGRKRWDAVQCIGWTIFERTHFWNKWTGAYRLEEDSTVVVMNLRSGEGSAWRGGREVADAKDLSAVLERANSIWINDAYWLLMPYKLKDTGVALKYEGTGSTQDGRPAHVLALTFSDVGDTPENRYRVWVDRESSLVAQWAYYASADDPEPRFTLPWAGWRDYGGIQLATDRGRTQVSGIRVSTDDEPAAFRGP